MRCGALYYFSLLALIKRMFSYELKRLPTPFLTNFGKVNRLTRKFHYENAIKSDVDDVHSSLPPLRLSIEHVQKFDMEFN